MNENYPYPEETAKQAAGQLLSGRRPDVTLRENLDLQIKQAEEHVAELKAKRERLGASGILDARIDDIQQAMRW